MMTPFFDYFLFCFLTIFFKYVEKGRLISVYLTMDPIQGDTEGKIACQGNKKIMLNEIEIERSLNKPNTTKTKRKT